MSVTFFISYSLLDTWETLEVVHYFRPEVVLTHVDSRCDVNPDLTDHAASDVVGLPKVRQSSDVRTVQSMRGTVVQFCSAIRFECLHDLLPRGCSIAVVFGGRNVTWML